MSRINRQSTEAEEGAWVALYSGGKDSSWALHQARQRGLDVRRLVSIVPSGESYMFHVPGIEWADVFAASHGISIHVEHLESPTEPPEDIGARGDRELASLERALESIRNDIDREVAGIVSGAVESDYQHRRLSRMCSTYDLDHFAPLWQADPIPAARRMISTGFDIRIVGVGAAGLDRSWLGRRYDMEAIDELVELQASYGVHPLGEGGEFETLVLNGPEMRSIAVEATRSWDGTRGQLSIVDARLAPTDASGSGLLTIRC